MACYNWMKADSRKQALAGCKAELAAIDAGTWPRDLNDDMRWGVTRTFHDMAEKVSYARTRCVTQVAYLEGIPARIAAGELPGWEPGPQIARVHNNQANRTAGIVQSIHASLPEAIAQTPRDADGCNLVAKTVYWVAPQGTQVGDLLQLKQGD